MPIYIIETKNNKVYHLIEGTCKIYDEDVAEQSNDEDKKKGVKEVKDKFQAIRDSRGTHLETVEVTDGTTFQNGNTDVHLPGR